MKLALIICIGLYIFTHFIFLLIRDSTTKAEKEWYWRNDFTRRLIIGISVIHYLSLWIGIILGLIYLYQIL